MSADSSPDGYVRRVLVALGLGLLALALVALLWYAFHVVLLVFGGVLFGVLLDGLARALAERTRLPRRAALAVVLVLLFGLLGLAGWLLGPNVAEQFAELGQSLPQALESLTGWLGQSELGRAVLEQIPPPEQVARSGSDVVGRITGMFSTVLGGLGNVFVITFIAIYGAFAPGLYVENALRLVPRARRDRAREVVGALAAGLRGWLKGRFAAMLAVGVLVTVGLWALGVPMALALGILAGLLDFVPFLGPIAAGIPGVLVALLVGPTTALYVLVLYGVVQALENYLITPLLQQRVVSMPPALLLAGQVLFGVTAGLAGVVFATPIMVCLIILVQKLYVEGVLGEQVKVMGEG